MATNKELLSKGVKYLFGALPLMFIGPSVMYNAFMNKKNDFHYVVLSIGCLLSITAVVLAFIGLNTIVKAVFNDEK